MLDALEELHSIGFIHRDVKPSNFVIHDEDGHLKIYLVDFGLCRQFKSPGGEIKPPREHTQFRGTIRYASLAAHKEEEQSPKDDLESWFYVVIELMTGELPWSMYHRTERDKVKTMKENVRTSQEGTLELLRYCPRTEFRRIMKYIDGLQYTSLPDYAYLRQLILLAMRNNDIRPDEPYDWETPDGSESKANGMKEHRPSSSWAWMQNGQM